jgi:hypothetical protein
LYLNSEWPFSARESKRDAVTCFYLHTALLD